MNETVLHCIIVEYPDGGQRMNSFLKEDSAVTNSAEVIKYIKEYEAEGMKVYLSELPYDKYNNRILTSNTINSDSKLLFQS